MQHHLWLGATAEIVIESCGRPVDVESCVTRAQVTETWKYQPFGYRRYGLRITFVNGIVEGWETK